MRAYDNGARAPSSDSDLSEAIDPVKPASPSPQGSRRVSEIGYQSRQDSLSSQDEDAIGSEDADFEMESPPPPAIQVTHEESSSSQDSRRPSKRKAGAVEDEHILNNPELYGIRRSVGFLCCPCVLRLTHYRPVLVNHIGSYVLHAPVQFVYAYTQVVDRE